MLIQLLIRDGDEVNAIDDATLLLAKALRDCGHDERISRWEPGRLVEDSLEADVLVIPYNPFMWGRWGYAPALVRDVAAVRVRRPRPQIVLLVHEPYVPVHDPKSLAMGAWQRAQLALLILLSDRRFASIEAWAKMFSRLRPTGHLPSGANVPDARDEREAVRSELGLADVFVVATLSTGNPAHLVSHVEATLRRLDRAGVHTVFFQLGAGASDVATPLSLQVERPGRLPAERLGAMIAAADLLLTPYVDGVSTRRGSFMAGLCEEVAVLGTRGALTDQMLLNRGLDLVDVGSPEIYALQAEALALDAAGRARLAHLGRELFDAEFTWSRIAARLLYGMAER